LVEKHNPLGATAWVGCRDHALGLGDALDVQLSTLAMASRPGSEPSEISFSECPAVQRRDRSPRRHRVVRDGGLGGCKDSSGEPPCDSSRCRRGPGLRLAPPLGYAESAIATALACR
jgi:hypothetical protein